MESAEQQRRALQQALIRLARGGSHTRSELFQALGTAKRNWQGRIIRTLVNAGLVSKSGSRSQPVYAALPEVNLRKIAQDPWQVAELLRQAARLYPSDHRANSTLGTLFDTVQLGAVDPADPANETEAPEASLALEPSADLISVITEIQTALLNATLGVAQGIIDIKAQIELLTSSLQTQQVEIRSVKDLLTKVAGDGLFLSWVQLPDGRWVITGDAVIADVEQHPDMEKTVIENTGNLDGSTS